MTDTPSPRKGGGTPAAPQGVRYAVTVSVDGKPLELREFLHDVIGGAVDGMLAGLRTVDRPKTIRLDVTRL